MSNKFKRRYCLYLPTSFIKKGDFVNTMEIYKQILKEKKESKERHKRLLAETDLVLEKLQQELDKKGIEAEVMLGGSAAKGTFVKNDFDCDVFIRFSQKYNDRMLSEYLRQALKKFKGIERVHGSRDYFKGKINGIDYEFVPVKNISSPEEAFNVTDSSPLHVEWMKNNIKKKPSLVDEIILTKLFCKAQRIYGAESYIKGFSGHVIDILLSYYKSFEDILRNSLKWEKGTIIDIENHNTASQINESKITSLIVVDPIQPLRNAAAALSMESMEYFKKKAKEFLDNPSKVFFEKKQITVDYLKSIGEANEVYILKAIPLAGKDDVVGTKLLKVFEHIKKHIVLHEFDLTDCGWAWDKADYALFWFVITPRELSEKKLREGPPIKVKKDSDKFMEKHPHYFIKDGRLFAYIKREFTKVNDLILSLLKSKYVSERVKDIKVIENHQANEPKKQKSL